MAKRRHDKFRPVRGAVEDPASGGDAQSWLADEIERCVKLLMEALEGMKGLTRENGTGVHEKAESLPRELTYLISGLLLGGLGITRMSGGDGNSRHMPRRRPNGDPSPDPESLRQRIKKQRGQIDPPDSYRGERIDMRADSPNVGKVEKRGGSEVPALVTRNAIEMEEARVDALEYFERRGDARGGFGEEGGQERGAAKEHQDWLNEYHQLLAEAVKMREREGGTARRDEALSAKPRERMAGDIGRAGDVTGQTANATREITNSIQAMHHELAREIRKLPHGQDATRFYP